MNNALPIKCGTCQREWELAAGTQEEQTAELSAHMTDHVLPDTWAVLIERDDEYNRNPGDFVSFGEAEDKAYVKRFADGELTAYVVSIMHESNGYGAGGWDYLGSLSGCDVETGNADNTYHRLDSIPDTYLRQVAAELLSGTRHDLQEMRDAHKAERTTHDLTH